MQLIRGVLVFLLLLLAILTFGMPSYAMTLMQIVLGLTALSCFLRLSSPPRISLLLFWEVGFLAIVGSEAMTGISQFGFGVGLEAEQRALQILIIGHVCVVFAGDFFSKQRRRLDDQDEGTQEFPIPWIGIACVGLFALAILVPSAMTSMQLGRAQILADAGPIQALASSAAISFPALVAVKLRNVRNGLLRTYLYSAPILLTQFTLGTRYALLFTIVPPLIISTRAQIKSLRRLGVYVMAGIILLGISSSMLDARSVQDSPSGSGVFGHGQDSVLSNEAVILNLSRLADYMDGHPHFLGMVALSVVAFPIPRSVWPDKPVLIGYWFPREYGLGGFSEVHSISLGFPGESYADFGLAGVVLSCSAIGYLLARGQRYIDWSISGARNAHHMAFAAVLFPAAFFAVRSPVTTLISLTGSGFIIGFLSICSSLFSRSSGARRRTHGEVG